MFKAAKTPLLVAPVTLALLASLATLASAATPPDACRVVTKAQAAAAVGTPIVSATPLSRGPSSSCTFKGTGVFKSVVITTFRWNSDAQAKSAFEQMVSITANMMPPLVAMHGLGDEADQVGTAVYLRKGTGGYVFNVINGSVGAAKASKAIALAKSAMATIH